MPKNTSLAFFAPKQPLTDSRNESIVAPCSTNSQSNDISCFTNSACYDDNAVIRATGQLQWQDLSMLPYQQNVSDKRWGTTFFIAPNLIMTAGHCFDDSYDLNGWQTPYNSSGSLQPKELAPLMKLNMDYAYTTCMPHTSTKPSAYETSYKIKRLVEYRLGNLDYAIAEVEGNPGSMYGYLSFDFSFQTGNIFAAQHPNGAPKKWESGYGQTMLNNGQQLIHHNVNTLPGSSGSALATFTHQVCGVHIQGLGKHNNKNTGVHIYSIFQKSPMLQALRNSQNPVISKEPSIDWLAIIGTLTAVGAVGAGATAIFSKDKNIKKIAGISSAALAVIAVAIILIHIERNLRKPEKDVNGEVQLDNKVTFQTPSLSKK